MVGHGKIDCLKMQKILRWVRSKPTNPVSKKYSSLKGWPSTSLIQL